MRVATAVGSGLYDGLGVGSALGAAVVGIAVGDAVVGGDVGSGVGERVVGSGDGTAVGALEAVGVAVG